MSVLVVTEQHDGRWHPLSLETLAAGQQLAAALDASLTALVIGADITGLAEDAAKKKLSEVAVLEHPLLERYTADAYAAAAKHAVEQLEPRLALFPHSYQVRDFAPKLAARLERPFVSDCLDLRVENGEVIFVRQLFQGKLQADVKVAGEPPIFASVQAGAFRADAVEAGATPASIRRLTLELSNEAIRTQPLERFQEAKSDLDLTAAEIIVSVGRGIQDAENLPLAEKLAAALGGELAASRPVVDNGWLPLERQVGSSGQAVAPKLYLALGISGAIQHVVGMKNAQTIVAVNKDESAPIFEIADYGIVGDLFEIVPALLDELSQRD